MKKMLLLALVFVLVFTMIACSSDDPAKSELPDSGTKEEAGTYKLKLGTTAPAGGHYVLGLEQFADKLKAYSGETITVEIYPSSQLGNERDLIEGVAMGTVEMCISSTGPLPNFVPDFSVLDLPYIFKSHEHAYEILDGEVGQKILGQMEAKGIKAINFWENGFRNITTGSTPVRTPEDLKGLKIRTMENDIHMEVFNSLGATATPMAFGELFTALQQGVVDGQENPSILISDTKMYEAQKYITLVEYVYSPAVLMINNELFNSFTAEQQEAFLKAAKEAQAWQRNYCQENEAASLANIEANGVEIIEVDQAEWVEATKGVYDTFKDKLNQEYFEMIK